MIKLYTTNCPKCNILKLELDKAKIEYESIHDVNLMMDLGIMSAPVLELETGEMLTFKVALERIRSMA